MIKFKPILVLATCSMMSIVLNGFAEMGSGAGGPEEEAAVLVNAQGLAQQDYSFRGSSYADTGISLNGVIIKVPYSAHYNSQAVAPGGLTTDASIRSGMDNVSGHAAGTIALQSRRPEAQSGISFGLGTEERYRTSALGSTPDFGGFLEWEKARSIDYDANDMARMTGCAFVQFDRNDWKFDLLGSGQGKEYGAQGYYGIPADVYAAEQTEDAALTASASKGDLDGSFLRLGAHVREFKHEYRIPTAAFLSDTRSRYGSAMIEGRTLEIQHLAVNLRGDLEHERISGDLGGHSRTRSSVLIQPEARFDRFTVKAGLNSVFQTDESAEWLPMAGLEFLATDNIRLFSSYSETVMQPDFQFLYYNDPYHIGNPDLGMQHARITEAGLHQFLSAELDWQVAAFHRRQEDAKDWVKPAVSDTAWSAVDLGKLDAYGVDAKLNYRAHQKLLVQIYYLWVAKDEYDYYAGLYELDYPEHLLGLSGFWQATPQIRLFGSQTVRQQKDHNLRTGSDFGAYASLGLHYDPRFAKNVRLSFLVENLWDTDFQSIAGLDPRPLSVSSGITVRW